MHLPTAYYVKGAHLQCVDVTGIHIISSERTIVWKQDVHYLNSGMDEVDHHEVLIEPFVGITAILV
jgi:hypothetical protein